MPNRDPGSDSAAISAEIDRLVTAAFAPATQATYETALASFDQFRASHGLHLGWPASPSQVVHFAAYLSLEEKAYSTVRTYLAGIGTKHRLNGWEDPTGNFLLKKLMQGFAKTDNRSDQRLPITLQRLQQLVNVLPSVCTNTFEVKLFKAAFTLPFFGFLRVSELVGQGMGDRRGRQGLKMADIKIGKDLTISIQGSKTDQQDKGTQLHLGTVGTPVAVCPVQAMREYLEVRPTSGECLFQHFNGRPLTRYQFQAVLKRATTCLGWDMSRFSSHSFRIGAATTAASHGVPVEIIMVKGRWRSSAVKKYIRPDSQISPLINFRSPSTTAKIHK